MLGLGYCTGLPLVVASRCSSSSRRTDFWLRWLLLLQSAGSLSGARGLQQLRLPGSGALTQSLWSMGLVPPRCVGSSQIRDMNPCLLPWQADSLPLSHQGRPKGWFFLHPKLNKPGENRSIGLYQIANHFPDSNEFSVSQASCPENLFPFQAPRAAF